MAQAIIRYLRENSLSFPCRRTRTFVASDLVADRPKSSFEIFSDNLLQIIPQVQYKSIADGTLSREQVNDILSVGTVIVKNAVPQEVRANNLVHLYEISSVGLNE